MFAGFSTLAKQIPATPSLWQWERVAGELVEVALPAVDHGRIPHRSRWAEQVRDHVHANPEGTSWCETTPYSFAENL